MTKLASAMIADIMVELHKDCGQQQVHKNAERAAWGVLFALEQCGLLEWKEPK